MRSHIKSSTEPYLAKKTDQGLGYKKVLVLDLDETLIHCESKHFEEIDAVTQMILEGEHFTLYLCKRPGLEDFLERMSKHYILYLYTSALKEYAEGVLKCFGIDHYFQSIYHRRHCKINESGKLEKSIAIFGVHPKEIILVDDLPINAKNQPSNTLIIRPFSKDKEDDQLPLVANFLEKLAGQSDVRPVMQKFIQFKDESDSKGPVFTQTAALSRNLKTKFMQDLKPSKEGTECLTQSNFRGIDENLDENQLETKLLAAKRLSMSPSRKLRDDSLSRSRKTLYEKDLKALLKESSQASNNPSIFETIPTKTRENSSSGDIAEKPLVMRPQPHQSKFKTKSGVFY